MLKEIYEWLQHSSFLEHLLNVPLNSQGASVLLLLFSVGLPDWLSSPLEIA
jgi:hypothetical protein